MHAICMYFLFWSAFLQSLSDDRNNAKNFPFLVRADMSSKGNHIYWCWSSACDIFCSCLHNRMRALSRAIVKWDKCNNLRPHTEIHTALFHTQSTHYFQPLHMQCQKRKKKNWHEGSKSENFAKETNTNYILFTEASVQLHSLLVRWNKCHPFTMKIHWIESNWIVWNGRAHIFHYRSINHILFVNRQTSVI